MPPGACRESRGEHMELPCRKWTHNAVGAKTREQAIEEMYADYDAHPGRRRKPARAAFEVYRTVYVPFYRARDGRTVGMWTLYVRVRPAVST